MQGATDGHGREQHLHLLSQLLFLVARHMLARWETQSHLFAVGEGMGVHLLPVHFYSPVPVVRDLAPAVWTPYDLAGVDWNEDGQRRLMSRLGRWSEEMARFPRRAPPDSNQFYLDNPAFGATDAAVYYALIREVRPARILEVGGGYSTMLAARAALENGNTTVDCVEPFPMPALKQGFDGLGRLIEQRVQDVPLEEFEQLGKGDILFIDCSHVSRIGSDVNHLILRVLPRLHDGVIVHIHDIFLPDEYHETWIKELRLFWNEQYVVYAFLLFNSRFRVLLSTHYLAKMFPDTVRGAFPFCDPPGGGSLWLICGSLETEEELLNGSR